MRLAWAALLRCHDKKPTFKIRVVVRKSNTFRNPTCLHFAEDGCCEKIQARPPFSFSYSGQAADNVFAFGHKDILCCITGETWHRHRIDPWSTSPCKRYTQHYSSWLTFTQMLPWGVLKSKFVHHFALPFISRTRRAWRRFLGLPTFELRSCDVSTYYNNLCKSQCLEAGKRV